MYRKDWKSGKGNRKCGYYVATNGNLWDNASADWWTCLESPDVTNSSCSISESMKEELHQLLCNNQPHAELCAVTPAPKRKLPQTENKHLGGCSEVNRETAQASPPTKKIHDIHEPESVLSLTTHGLKVSYPGKIQYIIDDNGNKLEEQNWTQTEKPVNMGDCTIKNNVNKLWQTLFVQSSGNTVNARLILRKLFDEAKSVVDFVSGEEFNTVGSSIDSCIAEGV